MPSKTLIPVISNPPSYKESLFSGVVCVSPSTQTVRGSIQLQRRESALPDLLLLCSTFKKKCYSRGFTQNLCYFPILSELEEIQE